MARQTKPIMQNFIQHFLHSKEGCWEWTAFTMSSGYGTYTDLRFVKMFGMKTMLAHRLSWSFFRGKIPEGLQVLHKCDNPKCVNPDHLFLGTQKDNIADCIQKKRHSPPPHWCGDEHPRSKLKADDVREIRKRIASKESRELLAGEFGISGAQLSRIVHRQSWGHIK